MLTRGDVWHSYNPHSGPRVVHNGAVRVNVVNNVPQTWAIMRPCSYADPSGAPYYCHTDQYYDLQRGGALPLTLPRQNVQMDPSDEATWRRQYYFTS